MSKRLSAIYTNLAKILNVLISFCQKARNKLDSRLTVDNVLALGICNLIEKYRQFLLHMEALQLCSVT